MEGEAKTLANCGDEEFLRQTWKIISEVEEWLAATGVMEIRKRLPDFEVVPDDAGAEERAEISERNEELKREQARKNVMAMLEAALDANAGKTARVIRLCCFVDPDDRSRPMSYYFSAFVRMLHDKDVIDFFISLMRLGRAAGAIA